FRLYALDGSTVRIGHSNQNLKEYPEYKNQHGSAHFPLVRIGIATNVQSGTAIRAAFGPYNGEEAASEIRLSEELLSRLPQGSVVLGDRYYGCFRFVFTALQHGHQVLCRFKELNAKRFIGKPETACGEQSFRWTPSEKERAKYPDLPADAAVEGKMVWGEISV